MFSKLKEKFKEWTKKLAGAEEEPEKPVKIKLKKEKKKKEVINKKGGKLQVTGRGKEIEMPVEFNAGMKQFQPNLEKIKEIEEEITKDEKEKKFEKEWEENKKRQELEDEEEKSFFSRIKSKIQKKEIKEQEFDVYAEELEMLLLENNVAMEVAEKIIEELKNRIVGKELLKKEIESYINETFKDIIREILLKPIDIVEKIKLKKAEIKEPYVILFCGINGSGKTTTIAKIAEYLKKKKISCVMAAADTFRAASIEQLKEHGEKIGIKVISHDYGSDPASVGFDAIKYAKKNFINCVLIDTAGRMHTSKNLLHEMEKIAKVTNPNLKIFVAEAITGNDAIEQAKNFNSSIGIDGIILTKQDIDEKGGTSLSVGYITKKPILFLGTGQVYDNIEPFDKEKFIEKLGL